MNHSEIDKAWIAEVRRRDDELTSGQVKAVTLEEALASIRAQFGW